MSTCAHHLCPMWAPGAVFFVRINPIRFLARCRKSKLNQSLVSLGLVSGVLLFIFELLCLSLVL